MKKKLKKIQIFRPLHRSTESEPLGWGQHSSPPGDPQQFGSPCAKPGSNWEKLRVGVTLETGLVFFFFFFFELPMQFQDFQKPYLLFQPLLFFDAEKLHYPTIFRKEGGKRDKSAQR